MEHLALSRRIRTIVDDWSPMLRGIPRDRVDIAISHIPSGAIRGQDAIGLAKRNPKDPTRVLIVIDPRAEDDPYGLEDVVVHELLHALHLFHADSPEDAVEVLVDALVDALKAVREKNEELAALRRVSS